MVVAHAVLEAADETQNPVDYYAGIAALCVVILFAKFSTHTAPGKKAPKDDAEKRYWKNLHVSCVILAWSAIALSLLVLAWTNIPDTPELWARFIVAIPALAASIILAMDVLKQD